MQIPDLINGDPAGFSFIHVSPGLDVAYHWMSDAVFANLPLLTSEAAIRMRVVAEASVHSVLLTTAVAAAPKRRIMALTLATARVSIRRAWGFADADIIDSQMMRADTPLAAAGTAVAGANVVAGVTAAAFATEREAVDTLFGEQMENYLPLVSRAAVGMPCTTGATLIQTLTHHYAAPHKRISDVVLQQVFTATPTYPVGIDADGLKDLMCHKTSHPVDSTKLTWLARQQETRTRLSSINLGSAGVRIPAKFQVEKSSDAFAALVRMGKQIMKRHNVEIDTLATRNLADGVAATLAVGISSESLRDAEVLVTTFKADHGSDVSYIGGFMTAMFDDMGATLEDRSVVLAYSVKGVMRENAAAKVAGMEHYQLAMKYQRAAAREGNLAGVGLMGAEAPPDKLSPEEAARIAARVRSEN